MTVVLPNEELGLQRAELKTTRDEMKRRREESARTASAQEDSFVRDAAQDLAADGPQERRVHFLQCEVACAQLARARARGSRAE